MEKPTMTMHLVHPSLSLTGKKRGKKKFASAAHAAKARELDADWAALMAKWGPGKVAPAKKQKLEYNLNVPAERSTRHIPSRDTGGNAVLAPAKVYTGTKVMGIATMHKSNAVPVFSDQEAIDISNMRRG
jgi:hypothetical protein